MKVHNRRTGDEVSGTFYFKPMENGGYGVYDQYGELQFHNNLIFGEATEEDALGSVYHVCQHEYTWDEMLYVRPVESYCKEVEKEINLGR